MPRFSKAGLALLQQLEGLRLEAYDDATGRIVRVGDRVLGTLTIGYGHTGPEVVPGTAWSVAKALDQLEQDVGRTCAGLEALLKVPIGDNRFSALACLAFNIGLAAVAGSSALHLANERRLDDVPAHIALWDKAERNGVLSISPGLVGRRAAEIALWALPDDAPLPDFVKVRDAAVNPSNRPGTLS